ncbi:hypothetical protein HD806DRAFT_478542 [Xylariaceae sp. AK1471]|nr:hypothetical protein HD806DRAFT_478542 [Xylariaceae sp. AK1471]
MLASLILEKRHIRKSQVVFYSIIRGTNDGPRTLAELILRSKRDLVRIESLLTFLLTIISLALQFSSTIIFSDLQESLVVADPVHVPVTNHIVQRVNQTYGSSSPVPPVYAIYGEVPSNLTSLPDSRGFSDNGLKERALLPLRTAENRTAVRSYHGNAVVMSSRVACMRPQIKGVYSAAPQGYIDGSLGTVDYGRMVGTVDYGSSLLNAHDNSTLCSPGGCLNATFDCTIPGSSDGTPPDWKTSYCIMGGVGGDFWSPRGIIQWNKTDDPWTANNLVHLIFTTNMMASEWASLNQSRAVPSPADSSYGEWNSIQIMPGRFLNISVCFSALNIRLSSVSMIAAGNLEEPRGNSTITGPGDSSPVRTFLGTNSTKQSHQERGILTIQDVKEPAILSAVDPYKRGSGWTLAQISTGYFEWQVYQKLFRSDRTEADEGQKAALSWRGCVICSFYGSAEHDEVALLWEDTIKSTGRAAEAMQAHMTVLALTQYNEFLKAFTGTEDAEIAFTRRMQTAAHCGENGCKGLATVAALVGSCLVCILVVTVIYVYQIRLSRQGNVWHTVAQLVGDELMETLKEGNFSNDDALKRSLRKGGKDSLVKLGRSKCGMVHVVKCDEST